MLIVSPLPTVHWTALPATVAGHPVINALSWVLAVALAAVLVVLVFKVARRIVHRLLGVAVSVAVSSVLHSQLAPALWSWLHR